MQLTEQFKLKINDWGMQFHETQQGFYLYVDLADDGKQAYRHFESESEAEEYMKDGLFFGYQGLWDRYINKAPTFCPLDVEF
ncbi:hypothetical protein [Anabaena sp. UHCC 0451]|uniref:hypothetical protein n=1 Tax=Anabaena sp. UHCC 0451 TaxID=2055235 RepID=UPI002B221033|nr:hypothetical protein [Anabaena sp. UHCC 0451]MEA5579703.1 hypothetical protein [Anabaena sp. UHCC 0451]